MKRRFTAPDWYQYHLQRSESDAETRVDVAFAPILEGAQSELQAARVQLAAAKRSEPLLSRVFAFFGVCTPYQAQTVHPLKLKFEACSNRLHSILERRAAETARAREQGASHYKAAHAARKQERLAAAERATQRLQHQRIRYLEVSRSIRSAAKALKALLISRAAPDGGFVTCFYCGVRITARALHLDHKKPISKGGTNRLSNLALACERCNLSKGTKTHDEYVRSREDRAL